MVQSAYEHAIKKKKKQVSIYIILPITAHLSMPRENGVIFLTQIRLADCAFVVAAPSDGNCRPRRQFLTKTENSPF